MTTTTAQHHCQRPGCKGILRSPESIDRKMSLRCARMVGQQIAGAEQGFSADQVAKARAAVANGEVTLDRDKLGRPTGLFVVKSSRGTGRYRSDGASCVCPAGALTHSLRCWHLLAIRVFKILTGTPAPVAPVIPMARPAATADVWTALEALGATGTDNYVPAF
jgi:hypothetical protein